jgi:tetratricopeptide (TPR) repeat protein
MPPDLPARARQRRFLSIQFLAGTFLLAVHLSGNPGSAQPPAGRSAVITALEQRVQQRPEDASAWRLLGKAWLKDGNLNEAVACLERAIRLDSRSAAAHCDLASAYMQAQQLQEAAEHFAVVLTLAPQSEYADMARQHLPQLPAPKKSAVVLAGFEIQDFTRSDTFPDTGIHDSLDEDAIDFLERKPFSLRMEIGGIYTTNVTLAPTSRQFGAGEADSFQALWNSDLEYRLLDGDLWRAGPSFSSYFTLNEGPFQDLNLQSYQPGFFVEKTVNTDAAILVPRVHYTYTLDEFSGNTFAHRHAMNTSLTSLWDGGDSTSVYWTTDFTNFADDGVLPAATSREGWTNAVGAHHTWLIPKPWLTAFLIGSEAQLADVDGSDFAYNGVSIYSEAEIPLAERLTLTLDGGWGYRDYHRFELLPSRNENIWSAGTRLRSMLSEHWSVVGVFRYDNFDSDNELFAAERIATGIVMLFDY